MIIVDDCSTDHTPELVASYQQEDQRIKLIRLDQNSEPAVAHNTAVDESQGRFIAFLGSDDLLLPYKLERQLNFMLVKGSPFHSQNREE